MNGELRGWDAITAQPLDGKVYRTNRPPSTLAFSSDGNLFVVGNKDGTSQVFDAHQFVPLGPSGYLPGTIRSVAFTAGLQSWIAIDQDGTNAEFTLLRPTDAHTNTLIQDAILQTGIALDKNRMSYAIPTGDWQKLRGQVTGK